MVGDTDQTGTVTIGQYLLLRLKQIGIDTIFGVPGDYNLPFLDLVEADKDLLWAGNINELNAAYAADGYARVKGAGALLTTFGVGELSAVNGIAGSYAEMIPVIHIVGVPKTSLAKRGEILHHTLGDGDHSVFYHMYSHITVASAVLTKSSAADQINRVIVESLRNCRPGYIGIPGDLVSFEIPMHMTTLDSSIPKNPPETQSAVLHAILTAIQQPRRPIILVDGCAQRRHMQSQVTEFVKRTGFPTYSTPMGLDVIDHTLPNYQGSYNGKFSQDGIKQNVDQSDLVLEIGAMPFDTNTGVFTFGFDSCKLISFHTSETIVQGRTFDKISMQELLPLVIQHLPSKVEQKSPSRPRVQRHVPPGNHLTQSYFWSKLETYLPPRSIVIAETGTISLSSANMTLPTQGVFISQIGWGSVGYGVPAALGAALADRSRRVFLLVGDGAFQLSAQELAPMLRQRVCPTILLINNQGFLVEKLIHGEAAYNDILAWKYDKSLDYFGATGDQGVQNKVTTRQGFEIAMDQVLAQPDRIHFIEAVFPSHDVVDEVKELAASFKR